MGQRAARRPAAGRRRLAARVRGGARPRHPGGGDGPGGRRLHARPGIEYFEAAADGESFAAGLLAALKPERGNPVAAAGRRLAERQYSIDALSELLAE